ncbi:hypothetical protein HYX14_01290 [Candidatus Woesearchaeota archaeon]|nr:hypothetical protein [Candidatus Woesearchaeota archaeon]
MMKRIWLMIAVLSLSLVAAVDVTIPQTEYSAAEKVSISISSCFGSSVLQIQNAENTLIGVEQGANSWSTVYNTLSDPTKGKYSLIVSCADGTSKTTGFCVDAPGCLGAAPAATQCGNGECDLGEDYGSCAADCPASGGAPSGGGTSGGGGGGGGYCTPQWTCEEWGYCNADLQQLRVCRDIDKCFADKPESRPCAACEESWVCSLWSTCYAGEQYRTCVDEHYCGSTALRPVTTVACEAAASLPPVYESPSLPPPGPPYQPEVQEPSVTSFWGKYKFYVLSIGLLVAILGFVLVLVFHVKKTSPLMYNYDDLKEWAVKERQMGTSDADIRTILAKHTRWTEQDIGRIFEELGPKS